MSENQSNSFQLINPSNTVTELNESPFTFSENEIYDVLIVGAGPIGLATAIGLRQRGIQNILVIDQTRAFRQVGQAIDLLPNGLTALKYLNFDAYKAVKQVGVPLFTSNLSQNSKTVTSNPPDQKSAKPSSEWVQKNLQGQRIRSFPLGYDDWVKEYGEGRISMGWYELQTTLRNLLPAERVQANHRCIHVVDEPEFDCVRVDYVSSTGKEFNPYAHWEAGQKTEDINLEKSENFCQQSEKKSLRAKLVVAADGINSTVRKVLYQDQSYESLSKPDYSGFAAIFCLKVETLPDLILREIHETFLQDARLVTISPDLLSDDAKNIENPKMLLFGRPDGLLGYLIHLPLPLDSFLGKSGTELINLSLPVLEKVGFPHAIQELVRLSPAEKMQQRPYYIHRATLGNSLSFPSTVRLNKTNLPTDMEPNWYQGRVVLVGDAAHGMPPFMAQGANQGLEDALIISTLIADLGEQNLWDDILAITQRFEKYQSLRRPFMVEIQQATLRRISYTSDQEWHSYNQKLYGRNFEQIIQTVLH